MSEQEPEVNQISLDYNFLSPAQKATVFTFLKRNGFVTGGFPEQVDKVICLVESVPKNLDPDP